MVKQIIHNYYTSQKSQLLRNFDKVVKRLKKVYVFPYDDDVTDILVRETRQEYEALIPQLPYIGGKKNPLTRALIISAWALAQYRVLKRHGKTVEESGKLFREVFEAVLNSYPKLLLHCLGRLSFTKFWVKQLKKQAAKSQELQYPGDWVYTFVEGVDKEFDYGIDYSECGVCKYLQAQSAPELAPFICLLDFPMYKAFGARLVRTMTIAEGADKCDFRLKRGNIWPHFMGDDNNMFSLGFGK